MMDLFLLCHKIKRKIWDKLVHSTKNYKIYPFLYSSYWHYLFTRSNTTINSALYYSARPNPGAGIGHQLANWIAGYWFAKQFDLKFAHVPFSSEKWEKFLGLGETEIHVNDLLTKQKYSKVLLPLFNEFNPTQIILIRNIISSYKNRKIVFIAEQDQFYHDQIGNIAEIKNNFYNASARQNDHLVYSSDHFNIAIHIRRGDIVQSHNINNSNHANRWQDFEYFENTLSTVITQMKIKKPVSIYLFSQGLREDFGNFGNFENIHFCLDMGAQDSFLHMVYADLLITSKSSFSYKPALLSDGICICPKNFWHEYPNESNYILVEDNGNFDVNQLKQAYLSKYL